MKLNYKNKSVVNIFKLVFDNLIPNNNENEMPSFTKAVNIKIFLKNILSNKRFKNSLEKEISFFTEKNTKLNIHKIILKEKIIENLLGDQMIKEYFGSKKVIKILEKRTVSQSKKNKLKKNNIYTLLKVVKNNFRIYKDV